MTLSFDEIDEKIVGLFQLNGRTSNRSVARTLGLSESAIRKRLKRLTESGAISYGLTLDFKATGLQVSGWLNLQSTPARARAVAEHIAKAHLCGFVFLATGKFNVRAFLYAKNLRAMRVTVEAISALEGVLNAEFREQVENTFHRYEVIIFPEEEGLRPRWPIELTPG